MEADVQQTVLLSKVLGVFLVIVGAAMILRRQYFPPIFAAIVEQRLLRAFIAMIELLAGLFLVVMHRGWSSLPAGIITLMGWMAIAESSAYLLLPDAVVARFIRSFSTPAWYFWGGVLALAIGLYLAAYGFGFH